MSKRRASKIILGLIFLLVSYAITALTNQNQSQQTLGDKTKQVSPTNPISSVKTEALVTRVVDGDTIEVLLSGEKKKVRLIGINSPESVDPRRAVECFGKDASNHAKELLTNKTVFLEADSSQNDVDKYKRLLRYVWLDQETNFNRQMIADGYAYEYTYDLPYKYQSSFKQAQIDAQAAKKGLWNEAACNGER